MSSKDAHLYGVPRPKKTSGKEISSSSSLAFTSELSSLITASKDTARVAPSAGRARTKKDDILSKHNRNSRKRALADVEGSNYAQQKHSTTSEEVDDATWKRARRKMEEKARLYAAMKRGDVEDLDERYAVDFDRKWAEAEQAGAGVEDTSSGEEDEGSEDDEIIEYEDEFGRLRKGTKAQKEREEQRMRAKERCLDAQDRFTARPLAPDNIIRGDTIQTSAFNPDAQMEQAMADIAARRDKSLTPPPDTHFNAREEVRQKGQGFFQFSTDEEERKKQMAELEKDREETERRRKANEDRKEARKREIEERRKAIHAKRNQAHADRFLDSLTAELGDSAEKSDEPEVQGEPAQADADGQEATGQPQ